MWVVNGLCSSIHSGVMKIQRWQVLFVGWLKKKWWSLILAMGPMLSVTIPKRIKPQWWVNPWANIFWMPFLTETLQCEQVLVKIGLKKFIMVMNSSKKWCLSKCTFFPMNALPSISDYFKTRNRTKLGLHSNRTAWLYIQTVNIYFDLELFFIKNIMRQWQFHFYFRHCYGVDADLFFYQCLSMFNVGQWF